MPSFSDILTKSAETIERPPLGPRGTYVMVVSGRFKKTDRKGYEVIDIPMHAVRPGADDVDVEELGKFGDPKNIMVRKSFLFPTDDEAGFRQTEFNMKEFLTKHLGQDEGLTMKELLEGAVNKQCLGVIDYRPNQENPEIMYHDLKRTAPLS